MNKEQLEQLITAITRIAYGSVSGPTGLEALSMSIAGEGLSKPLSDAVYEVAEGLNNIADAIDRLAAALNKEV